MAAKYIPLFHDAFGGVDLAKSDLTTIVYITPGKYEPHSWNV